MRLRNKISIALAGLFLLPQVVSAYDLFGSYFGILPMETRNSISVVHRYRVYNGYRSLNQNGQMFPTGAYRLPQVPSVLHGTHGPTTLMTPDDYESFKLIELKAKYFVTPKIQLDVSIPFVNNKTKALGNQANVWGMGDAVFCAGYRVVQSDSGKTFSHRLVIGVGAKFPTGSIKKEYSNGDRLPLMLQPGTGSVDALGMLTYVASYQDWLIGLISYNAYPFENRRHEQLLPVTNNTLIVGKRVDKGEWKLYPQAQLYQEYTDGATDHGYKISGTEMNNILLGAGLECYRKHLGINMCFQIPVYQEVFEMNMEMTARAMLGVSWNFDRTL